MLLSPGCGLINYHSLNFPSLIRAVFLFRFLGNDVHQTVLQSFLVFGKPILFPSVIKELCIEIMTLHATVKESYCDFVVWRLFKLQRSAVFHVLFEFGWVSTAEIFKRRFYLFLLDSIVLFILASTWEALPW